MECHFKDETYRKGCETLKAAAEYSQARYQPNLIMLEKAYDGLQGYGRLVVTLLVLMNGSGVAGIPAVYNIVDSTIFLGNIKDSFWCFIAGIALALLVAVFAYFNFLFVSEYQANCYKSLVVETENIFMGRQAMRPKNATRKITYTMILALLSAIASFVSFVVGVNHAYDVIASYIVS